MHTPKPTATLSRPIRLSHLGWPLVWLLLALGTPSLSWALMTDVDYLDFGSVVVGNSATANLTITNDDSTVYANGVTISIASTEFTVVSNNCANLAPGYSCTAVIEYTPADLGDDLVPLDLYALNTTQPDLSIDVGGTGISSQPPSQQVFLSPSSLSFTALIGTTATLSTTLTNTGTQSLFLTNITTQAPYSQTNNCPTTLVGGESCTINVSFSPTTTGPITGVLTVETSDGNFAATASLSLDGTVLAGRPQIAPTALNLTAAPGATDTQQVVLTNSGDGPLNIANISTQPPFGQTNDCPGQLNSGEFCTITVTYSPNQYQGSNDTGALAIHTTDGYTTYNDSVPLNGEILFGDLVASPVQLDFAALVGQSDSRTLTLTNQGTAGVSLDSVTLPGPFTYVDNCPSEILPNTNCTLEVTYTPTQAGNQNATLTIVSNDGTNNQTLTIPLAASGLMGGLQLSTTSLNFSVLPGQSATQSVTLTNNGSAELVALDFILNAPFFQDNNCVLPLLPGASCQITVEYAPTQAGSHSDTLTINASDGSNAFDQSLALSGNAPQGNLSLSPTNLQFTTSPGGTDQASATLTNTGNATVTLVEVSTTAPFTILNGCPGTLAAGNSCQITVEYAPTQAGTHSGTLTIRGNNGVNTLTQTASLTGQALLGELQLSASALILEGALGSTANQSLVLTNQGNDQIQLTGITATPPFSLQNNCPANLAPGAQCTVVVEYQPNSTTPVTGTLEITGNSNSGQVPISRQVQLEGRGQQGQLAITPSQVSLNAVPGNQASQNLTLTNPGALAVTLTAISVQAPFSVNNGCPTTLPPGGSCTLTVSYAPSTSGVHNDRLEIQGSDGNTNLQALVDLVGRSLTGELNLSAQRLNFEAPPGGVDRKTLTLTNGGNGELWINSIQTSAPFSLQNNCPTTLLPGDQCTVEIQYQPQQGGTHLAQLYIQGNDIRGAFDDNVQLTGQAAQGRLTLSPGWLDLEAPVGDMAQANITLSNEGEGPLHFLGLATQAPFSYSSGCPDTLEGGEHCTIEVRFAPADEGRFTGSLEIRVDEGAGPHTQSLSLVGEGLLNLGLEADPSQVAFPSALAGSDGTTQILKLTNSGNVPLTIQWQNLALPFGITGDCQQLAAGAQCQLELSFAPTQTGDYQTQLIIVGYHGERQVTLEIPLNGATLQEDDIEELLKAAVPNADRTLTTLIDTIASSCVKEGIDEALKRDCATLVTAAEAGDPALAEALESITPRSDILAARVVHYGVQVQMSNLTNRLQQLRRGARGINLSGLGLRFQGKSLPGGLLSGGAAGGDEGLLGDRWGLFVSGTLSWGEKDEDGHYVGFDFDTQGITAGLDYRWTDNLVIGFSLGYMDTSSDFSSQRGEADVSAYSLGIYGTYWKEDYFLEFFAIGGRSDHDQSRRVSYQLSGQAPVLQEAQADFDGSLYSLHLGGGYDFNRNGWTLTPQVGLDYARVSTDGFTETMSDPDAPGGGWAVTLDDSDQTWLTLSLGGKATYTWNTSWGVLTPYAGLDWLHEFKDDSRAVTGTLALDRTSSRFVIESNDPDRDYFRLNLGATAVFKGGISAYIDYTTTLANDHWQSDILNLGFHLEF